MKKWILSGVIIVCAISACASLNYLPFGMSGKPNSPSKYMDELQRPHEKSAGKSRIYYTRSIPVDGLNNGASRIVN